MPIPSKCPIARLSKNTLSVLVLCLGAQAPPIAHGQASSQLITASAPAPLASHRQQRASRDLHGAKRYMDQNSIAEAQNILEEDDDQRGSQRLA